MKKFIIFILLVILGITSILGVNLIPNPDFENWTNDYICNNWLPDSSSSFYISRENSTVYSGSYSLKANIFTQNQSSTDLISDTFAVVPGDTYDFSFRFFDNDAAANGRYYFYYFDASKNYLSNYYGSYTSDSGDWQFISGQEIPDAGVYYMLVGFRFYDVSASWDGDAYIYVDSVYFGNDSGSSGNIPPTLTSLTHIPSTVTAADTVSVSVDIMDESGIIADTCYYAVGTGGSFASVQSDSVVSNDHYYKIGSFSLNDTVYYYVKAVDDSSASTVSDTISFIVYDVITGIDISGYTLYQYDSYQSYIFSEVTLPDNGYLIIARDIDKLSFESYYGITLGGNVTFINSNGSLPQANGGETYSLYTAGNAIVDSTTAILSSGNTYERDSTNVNTWTQSAWASATPGSGANGGYSAGIVINEYTDPGNFVYEYVELYYDGSGSIANTPPVFSSHNRIPLTPSSSEQAIISIIISDNSGINADSLFYSVNSSAFNAIYHDSLYSGRYYFTIPQQSNGSSVDYYFYAMDDSSETALSDTFSYTVQDGSGTGMNILFDFSKEEDAGNADWIIDTNYPKPLPDNPSAENDWLGAISHWGFELDSSGYMCRTLPPGYTVTYGSSDSMDLQFYDVYIIPEPQNPFTEAEKTAIFDFVRDGGGLFIVADHNASDRNSNGWDSPRIFNDMGTPDSFGMYFNITGDSYNSVSPTCNSFTGLDSIYNGKYGNAQGGDFIFHAGTTMPASGTAIEIAPHPDNSSYSMFSAAYFGNGKVAGTGDSSPADDGTGQSGNTLYNGWEEGVSRILILNATWWLSINSGNTDIKESFISTSRSHNSITVSVRSNRSDIHILRLYSKEWGDNQYRYIMSLPYDNNVDFEEQYIDNTTYFKVTGIKNNGEEVYIGYIKALPMNNIVLSKNIIINGTITLNTVSNIPYTIYDNSGRCVLSGIAINGNIDAQMLSPGIYTLEAGNSRNRITIIK